MDIGEYLDLTYMFYDDPMGAQFVRCEYCGVEVSTKIGEIGSMTHRHDCLRPSVTGRSVEILCENYNRCIWSGPTQRMSTSRPYHQGKET